MTDLVEKERQAGEDPVGLLAERLHFKMEHLDPSEDDDWLGMSDDRRMYYRLLVEAVLDEPEVVRHALGLSPTTT